MRVFIFKISNTALERSFYYGTPKLLHSTLWFAEYQYLLFIFLIRL
jgi:hypothetical protein